MGVDGLGEDENPAGTNGIKAPNFKEGGPSADLINAKSGVENSDVHDTDNAAADAGESHMNDGEVSLINGTTGDGA